MKSLLSAVVVASALVVPAVSFAQQSNGPLTREQVRAEIVVAQQNGTLYQNDVNYPKAAPLTTADVAAAPQQTQAIGGVSGGASQSGNRPSVEQSVFSTYRSN